MLISYGGYSFQQGAPQWTLDVDCEMEDDMPVIQIATVALQGMLLGSSPQDLASQCRALEQACRIPYQDLVLRDDNGVVLESLRSSASLNGVRCIKPPSFGKALDAELVTHRSFSVTFSCAYLATSGNVILNWTQTLVLSGGLPHKIFQPATSGSPMAVTTIQQTTYKATQTGSAVGLTGYPIIPQPIFGIGNLIDYSEPITSPRRRARGYSHWPVAWNYQFESVSPLRALPGVPPV